MDQFGVLVESIGFKSQGRSAPMADLKGKTSSNNGFPQNLGTKSGFGTHPSSINRSKSPHNSNSVDASFIDDLDGIFRSSNNRGPQNYSGSNGYDDIFGWPNANSKPPGRESMFDLDSVFKGSSNLGSKSSASLLYDDADDIFGKMPELKSPETVNYDKVFGSIGSPPTQSDSIDDLLGDFGRMGSKSNGSRRNSGKMEKNASESDDLIPGFGGSSPSSNGEIKAKEERESREQRVKEKDKVQRRIGDEKEAFEFGNDLESFFSMGAQSRTAPSHKSTTEDSLFDTLFQNREGSKVERTSSGTSSSKNKASSVIDSVEDFSFLFGSGAAPSSGEFQEVEGESEERRRARLNHYLRTQQRMAKALDEKNRRDLETQQEQDERHRLAETLDDGIKRWAAGKEGNLRALLSSLQYVLWPECGWQQVSLTDLITSVSVKKVYYKATLCVHPDKVQQKGANLQQKYIAEKVFDLLKEAWNKFSLAEL